MTDEEIAELKRLEAAATPAPWSAFTDDTSERRHTNIVAVKPRTAVVFSLPGFSKQAPDIEFLCAARNTLPRLLADFTGLRRQLAEKDAWQPIETAPKDGTEIQLAYQGRVTAGHWLVVPPEKIGDCGGECRCPVYEDPDEPDCWVSLDGGFTQENPPTHWMPLSVFHREPKS